MRQSPWRLGLAVLLVLGGGSGCSLQPQAGREAGRPAAPPGPRAPSPAGPAAQGPAPAAAVPAVLAAASRDTPDGASRCLARIESFAELHSGSRVMLGAAAFARSDQLVLTRVIRRGPDGTPLDGRAAVPRPMVLGLTMDPQGCLIRVVEEGPSGAAAPGPGTPPRSMPLPDCTCLPLGG